MPKRNKKSNISSFKERVFNVVAQIPAGKTLSYKEVAEKAESPKAFRAVGSILKTNFDARIPCHRVVRSNGTIGQYNRGSLKKMELLKKEGVL